MGFPVDREQAERFAELIQRLRPREGRALFVAGGPAADDVVLHEFDGGH